MRGGAVLTMRAAASPSLALSFPLGLSPIRRSARSRSLRPFSAAFASSSAADAAAAATTSSSKKQLVLYSKPGCCLCDGLKEKLHTALSLGGPHSLHSVHLRVRDITTNPEWERRYQYEIPVLSKLLPDGNEEILPRLSPRLGVELIQKKLAAALEP